MLQSFFPICPEKHYKKVYKKNSLATFHSAKTIKRYLDEKGKLFKRVGRKTLDLSCYCPQAIG